MEPRSTRISNGASIAKAGVEAVNRHDVDQLVQLYSAGYSGVDVGQAREVKGRSSLHETVSLYLEAFPDLELQEEDIVSEGNRVVLRWIARGTQQGTIMNIPPSGRRVEVRGVSTMTIENGEVIATETVWDVAGMLRSLGLLPELR
jgi:steroid delta-isomerase-like uncharacterized protein